MACPRSHNQSAPAARIPLKHARHSPLVQSLNVHYNVIVIAHKHYDTTCYVPPKRILTPPAVRTPQNALYIANGVFTGLWVEAMWRDGAVDGGVVTAAPDPAFFLCDAVKAAVIALFVRERTLI